MTNWLETIFSGIAAVAAVVAAIIAKRTLIQMRNEQQEGLEREQKQATLDAYNILQDKAFNYINQIKPSEIQKMNKQAAEYKELSACLARIEHFCVGLRGDIYDMDTFYALAHGYFDDGTLYSRIRVLIDRKNPDSGDDYFENIHWVMDRMAEKQNKKDK